ncbi:MAG TPA: DUF6775 family putative metallopeptidase [Dehalococcoidia bacterium]|nr:DUF6775 family putative metallopeptidase [Dehalococcoidia bacterium]
MAVRPGRKDPLSTRAVYLPRVSAKQLQDAANAAPTAPAGRTRVYIETAPAHLDVDTLLRHLSEPQKHAPYFAGELVAALARCPQTQIRDAVAAAANRLAWARIDDATKRRYRRLPRRGDVDQEEAQLKARSQPEYDGIDRPSLPLDAVYDAAEVQAAYREMLSLAQALPAVVVTGRRLATWDADRERWAETASLAGDPALVHATATAPVDGIIAAIKKARRI